MWGSGHLLVNSSNNPVVGSRTWYLPFGGYRPGSAPTQTITDRDFTGQRENMELGLLYYNARYYVPYINRFLSADSIVPDPANPQSFNRYSYAYNNPLRFRDVDGHRPCEWVCPGDWIPVGSFTGAGYNGPWNIQQQQENSARAQALMVDVIGTAVGIIWEPADWAIALSDGVQWYDGLGMLPLVPAAFGDNIGRAVTRFIPSIWADDAGQHVGYWVSRNLPNTRWARYQAHVTGVESAEFMLNGTRFDGVIGSFDNATGQIGNLTLLDAKDWTTGFVNDMLQGGYRNGRNYDTIRNEKVAEAWAQINAANGVQIQWHFSSKEAADLWRDYFRSIGIDEKLIKVVETSWP